METADSIKIQLKGIREEYDSIQQLFAELENMPIAEYKKSKHNIGVVIEAAKIAETVIIYICRNSDISVTAKHDKHEPDFADYIFHASKAKIISERERNEFDFIRKIRNNAAHRSVVKKLNLFHEPLSKNKVGMVHESLRYLLDWFFMEYLNNKYPDLTLTHQEINREQPIYKKLSNEDETSTPQTSANNPYFNSANYKPRRKRTYGKVFFFIFIICFGFYFVYPYFTSTEIKTDLPAKVETEKPVSNNFKKSDNFITNTVDIVSVPKVTKELAFSTIQSYYQSIIGDTFQADKYFAEEVKYFKNLEDETVMKNVSNEEISKNQKEYFSDDFSMYQSYLKFLGMNKEESEWQYIGKLSDFKKGESDDQQRRILIKFTLNKELKITSLTEVADIPPQDGS